MAAGTPVYYVSVRLTPTAELARVKRIIVGKIDEWCNKSFPAEIFPRVFPTPRPLAHDRWEFRWKAPTYEIAKMCEQDLGTQQSGILSDGVSPMEHALLFVSLLISDSYSY